MDGEALSEDGAVEEILMDIADKHFYNFVHVVVGDANSFAA